MGEKPLSIRYGEEDHILWLLETHVEADDKLDLAALIEKIAGEPRGLLSRNPSCSLELENAVDLEGCIDLLDRVSSGIREPAVTAEEVVATPNGPKRRRVVVRLSRAVFNTFEIKAATLLVRLYALLMPSAVWQDEKSDLEIALFRYLYERDCPEADRTREARRKGGEQAARNLLVWTRNNKRETEKEHALIRADAKHLLQSGIEPRNIAYRLAMRYKLSTRQIRRIIKPKPK